MTLLALVLISLNPIELVARDTVDLVEVNSFYDDQGRLVFDQTIFYDWSPPHGRYMVRAWRLVKNPHQIPDLDHASGKWRCLWNDGEVTRLVIAGQYRRTWEQFDPEHVERHYFPEKCRKGLQTQLTPAARPR